MTRTLLHDALANSPFPWQEQLLERLLRNELPRALDLPTGLGKTSVMAIWLVARALGASVPRRLVYVVDRRAIVDQATSEAVRLRDWAATVDELRLGDRGLPVSTLRGQFADNREWLEDPASPAIVVGTVDMIGSRLLFEGYACSRKMRPFHAGLLGCDTLFVLDEAHLVPPFERLLEGVCGSAELWPDIGDFDAVIPRPRLMSLSATGRHSGDQVFTLTKADREHAIVRQRIHATKCLNWHDAKSAKALPRELAAHAWRIASECDKPVRVLVFANKRDDAESAKAALLALARVDRGKDASLPAAELFVGARRVRERERAAEGLRELGFLAGGSDLADHAFVFATSAGEVGVDLDADHAVSDVVAWERMVQRLGRVNRRGGPSREATVVLVADPDGKFTDGVRPIVELLPPIAGGARLGSPAALMRVREQALADDELADRLSKASTPEPDYPALELPLVEAWAMTSLPEHTGRPEVQPWIRGWPEDDQPQTTVVWRDLSDLTELGPGLSVVLEATPPQITERLETGTPRVSAWLKRRAEAVRRRAKAKPEESLLGEKTLVAICLDAAHEPSASRFNLSQLADADDKRLQRAIAGQTVVVHAHLGGLSDDGLLDIKADDVVVTPERGDEGWYVGGRDGDAPIPFKLVLEHADDQSLDGEDWVERVRVPLQLDESGEDVSRYVVVYKRALDSATEDDRSAGKLQGLAEHHRWTAEEAGRLTDMLGMPEPLAIAITTAARLHDEGKRANRWQRAFRAPDGKDAPYAKTPYTILFKLLGGYRHEFGSLPLAERDPKFGALLPEYQELVRHLIVAHHGFARPVIRTDGCDGEPPSVVLQRAQEVALRFLRLQAKFGPWRLAWLEALVRAADQRASRRNQAKPTKKSDERSAG
ncbi:MAG: type I-U CRISPR-associated helicase/endonuclease Cas3 [Enhygromyxa sp.]